MAPSKKLTQGEDWEAALGRPEGTCASCSAGFREGDVYFGSVAMGDASLERRDLCPACFDALASKPLAFWRGRVPQHDARKPRPLDLEFLVDFFKRLQALPDRKHVEVGYIVALLLLRKKILRQVRTERDGDDEWLVVVFAREEEAVEQRVLVPVLTEDKIETIKDDLGRIFNLDA